MIISVFLETFCKFSRLCHGTVLSAGKRVRRWNRFTYSYRPKHNTRILYYKRGNAIVKIISYPAIIGVAMTRYFAAARLLFFATFGASRRLK